MLVLKVLGDCPKCDGSSCFGNCMVQSGWLVRGCKNCGHSIEIPLCELNKKVVYLDQFFFSMDYRQSNDKIVRLSEKMVRLVGQQLLVTPFSPVHRDETNLWGGHGNQTPEGLIELMKKRAKGAEFKMHGSVVRSQMLRAFDTYRTAGDSSYSRSIFDAVHGDFNEWHDYRRVEVEGYGNYSSAQAKAKNKITIDLSADFEMWRDSTSSFEEDVLEFSLQMVRGYWQTYAERVTRSKSGDMMALADGPIIPLCIGDMIHIVKRDMDISDPYKYVSDFLVSDHLRKTPYHFLACRILAALKSQVKKGAHTNLEKFKKNFGGFFFDVLHIATYAPYSDAIFVDNAMANLLSDRRIRLGEEFGTEFFSLSRASNFDEWLDSLEKSADSSLRESVNLTYPGRWP